MEIDELTIVEIAHHPLGNAIEIARVSATMADERINVELIAIERNWRTVPAAELRRATWEGPMLYGAR